MPLQHCAQAHARNGYTNLVQHVRREHPNYENEMLAAPVNETGSLARNVKQKSMNLFGWMDWILKNNLPLIFCENKTTRMYHYS